MVCLEMNRDHFVIFEIVSKYCILDSFVDYDGFSISSNGFLPVADRKWMEARGWPDWGLAPCPCPQATLQRTPVQEHQTRTDCQVQLVCISGETALW